MEKEYIKFVLNQIKETIDELNKDGITASYPRQVEIELSGVKIIVPWL